MKKPLAAFLLGMFSAYACVAGSTKVSGMSLTSIRGEIDSFVVGEERPYVAVGIGKHLCVLKEPDVLLVEMLRAYARERRTYPISIDPAHARCLPFTRHLPSMQLKWSK